jgi:hypothetical protein
VTHRWEEDGFELAVPPRRERLWAATPGKYCRFGPEPVSGSAFRAAVSDWAPRRAFRRSGTYGSNPVPSSGGSGANLAGCRAWPVGAHGTRGGSPFQVQESLQEQENSDVVATGSGSIDLTDLSIDGTGFITAGIIPALPTGSIITWPASSTAAAFYSGYTGPASFRSGSGLNTKPCDSPK